MQEVLEQERVSAKPKLGQNSRRAYLSELRKVVESADVILHILDARDPLGTRSTTIEDMVLSNHRKKLVYVLNKVDLIPRDVLIDWLAYFRRLHPTFPFKCNLQEQSANLSSASGKVIKTGKDSISNDNKRSARSAVALGAEELLGLLKNYCRNGDLKTTISVGIVGFPNVGKSSLINSLTRARSAGVSPTPGFTRNMQEIVLDKHIRLLDSPGIVFADGNSAATSLRNCVNVDELEDLFTPVQAIVDKCPAAYLMKLYSIPKFPAGDATAFLASIARVSGKLKKGGSPNVDAAAKTVLRDWNSGKIRYYCRPPNLLPGEDVGDRESVLQETKVFASFTLAKQEREEEEERMETSDSAVTLTSADRRVLDEIDAIQEEEIGDAGFVPMDSVSNVERGSEHGAGRIRDVKRTKELGGESKGLLEVSKTDDLPSYDFEHDFSHT